MSRSTPGWIARHDDEAIPPRVKVRIWFRYNGQCAKCERKLRAGDEPQYDHIVALCNSGLHRESNLQLLCSWCHRIKSKRDVAEKSMVYRKQIAHLGFKKKPKGQPMPGTKASGWRHKLNGTWERQP